jgi:hypothetical protein
MLYRHPLLMRLTLLGVCALTASACEGTFGSPALGKSSGASADGTELADLPPGAACEDISAHYATTVTQEVTSICILCHTPQGAAQDTRLHLSGEVADDLATIRALMPLQEDGMALLLAKPSAQVAHGGGKQLSANGRGFAIWESFLRTLDACDNAPVTSAPTLPPMTSDGRYACGGKTYGSTSSMRRLTQNEYQNAITDLFGIAASDKYPDISGRPVSGYSTEASLSVLGEQGVELVLDAAIETATTLRATLATLLPCSAEANKACATSFLDTFGRRAFRRALTAEEKTDLLAIYDAERADSASFLDATAVMAAAMLQMPAFLYLAEAPSAAGVDRPLSMPELAARMAFHFWNSIPDDALLDAGVAGDLSGQAERLAADPRASRGFVRFVRELAEMKHVQAGSKDALMFPELDQAMADALNESFDRFVIDQMQSGGSMRSLLRTASYPVNATVAPIFATTGPASGWSNVSVDPTRYSGLLTHPAFLASAAHSDETSYVFRGRMIRKRLLCDEIGAPPANAEATAGSLPMPSDPTGKEKSAVIRSNTTCAGCHDFIDPAGLALERFDALGKWRTAYTGGKGIDVSGELDVKGSTVAFADHVQMAEALASSAAVETCFARQVFRYAAARKDDAGDVCAVQTIGDALRSADLRAAFIAAVTTDSFRYRRGE